MREYLEVLPIIYLQLPQIMQSIYPIWRPQQWRKGGFQMPPLPSSYYIGAIYTICLKSGIFRQFQPMLRQIGQSEPVGTSPQILTEKTKLFLMGSFQMKAKPLLFKWSKRLLHQVSILGPLGYEPNTLPLRHGALTVLFYHRLP